MKPTEKSLAVMKQIGGRFAKAMAEAYLAADPVNQQALVAAFGNLYGKYVLLSEQVKAA